MKPLQTVIDGEQSGGFRPNARGWMEWHYRSQGDLDELNAHIGRELEEAVENHRERWYEGAKNAETYRPIPITLNNDGGVSVLPAPTARKPADQIIASTIIKVIQQPVIVSFDPHFDAEYDVMIPVDAEDMRAAGAQYDAEVMGDVTIPAKLSSEVLAHQFERKFEFQLRERLNGVHHIHDATYRAVSGQRPWWHVFAQPESATVIQPKNYGFVVDTNSDEYSDRPRQVVRWQIVPDDDVLRPNFHQPINDLDWLAHRNRDLQTSDSITRAYHAGDLFLLKDAEECEAFGKSQTVTVSESRQRIEAKIDKVQAGSYKNTCDVWDLSVYAWLKTKEDDGVERVRRWMLFGPYHRGMRRFMAIYRYPYRHQRRNLVPFKQYIDDQSTVGLSRYAQNVQTHLSQAEIRSAMAASIPVAWHLAGTQAAEYLDRKGGQPIRFGESVPGKYGEEWGFAQAGFPHYSLLPHLQWIDGSNMDAVHMQEYGMGARVVSHTSPRTVDAMLDRGGQNQLLFLNLLNESFREVVRLTLETEKEYAPVSDNVPVRDPQTKAIHSVPFYYPVADVLDNFNIRLTAADENASRERDPNQMAIALESHQKFTEFAASVLQAIRMPESTPEDIAFFKKVLQSHQEMYDREVSARRVDIKKFDLMAEVEAIAAARTAAIQEAVSATNNAGTIGPAAGPAGAGIEGLAGVGPQPGMEEGGAPPSGTGNYGPY